MSSNSSTPAMSMSTFSRATNPVYRSSIDDHMSSWTVAEDGVYRSSGTQSTPYATLTICIKLTNQCI